MAKKKLTVPEQIKDMKEKGITFMHTPEKDICNFLKYNNYYFKLKSYGKNYDKYLSTDKKGQYINLNFAYLQELSKLDMYLRSYLHFYEKYAYNNAEEQKNIDFFRGNGACIVSVFFCSVLLRHFILA